MGSSSPWCSKELTRPALGYIYPFLSKVNSKLSLSRDQKLKSIRAENTTPLSDLRGQVHIPGKNSHRHPIDRKPVWTLWAGKDPCSSAASNLNFQVNYPAIYTLYSVRPH